MNMVLLISLFILVFAFPHLPHTFCDANQTLKINRM